MKAMTFLIISIFLLTGFTYAEDYLIGEKDVKFRAEKDTLLIGADEGLFNTLIIKLSAS